MKGNMTLEAAIIVPIVMVIILLIIKTGVDLRNANVDKSTEYVDSISESINNIEEKRKTLYKYKIIEDEISSIIE